MNEQTNSDAAMNGSAGNAVSGHVPKRRFEYILLCYFGGAFGLHKLYLGETASAMTRFWIAVGGLICCAGIPTFVLWVMSLVDLFKAAEVRDSEGVLLV